MPLSIFSLAQSNLNFEIKGKLSFNDFYDSQYLKYFRYVRNMQD